MHWVSGQSGDFDSERDLILPDQTPADVIFLSAADTDLTAVSNVWAERFRDRLRVCHAAPLRQPVAADYFVQNIAAHSSLLIARLLGGESYFPHLIQALSDLKNSPPQAKRVRLLLLNGTRDAAEALERLSDFSQGICEKMHRLFLEGGAENMALAAAFAEKLLAFGGSENEPDFCDAFEARSMQSFGWNGDARGDAGIGNVWVSYYRAWHQCGDLELVECLIQELTRQGLRARAFYCDSLRDVDVQRMLMQSASEDSQPDVILALHSFSVSAQTSDVPDGDSFPSCLNCPVLQVPVSTGSRMDWERSVNGLSPAETAIQVALPEIDGRILTTVSGFKEQKRRDTTTQVTLKVLQPAREQVAYIAQYAAAWARLRKLPNSQKKIALVLSNYPNRDGRVGNGVGLDTPASAVALLQSLREAGYRVSDFPENGTLLIQRLLQTVTNDPGNSYGKKPELVLPTETWNACFESWPEQRKQEMRAHWPDQLQLAAEAETPVSGIQLGNVFLGIQPPRGFSLQDQAIYHSPDLPPPPVYAAFYAWIRTVFGADAIVHLGKHGNLEWLPGKAVALGPADYPRLCLGPLPHLYPFIVNNPGEGTQAKRRTAAVIIDHLTPPLTRAGLYGDLEQLERLLEEHTHACALYPRRAAELENRIQQLIQTSSWKTDLPQQGASLPELSNFLCELKESQIRSGLHILGSPPEGHRLTDFLMSLLRLPQGRQPGLLAAIHGSEVDFSTLTAAERDALDTQARAWIESAISTAPAPAQENPSSLARLAQTIHERLLPSLRKTSQELSLLLHGLNGGHVPSGPAGAPTRGRADVLPTGRNFYALDPRIIPTPLAWTCGKALAESLMKRHFQDHGEPLRSLALVVWGTSNMRTGGDDLAQALWLWGCEPVWEESSGRVVDFRILPAELLGRPRVDITLRVSGLFRDAFGDTARLLATIPKRLAALDEPPELNPIRASWTLDYAALIRRGTDAVTAARTAALRVFTSAPGCYGSGLLPLLDAGNWNTHADIARVFLQWGHHAVGTDGSLTPGADALREQLARTQAVVQNQDNREHDILDSDDYFQFQGGLHSTITVLRGSAPATYHGDSSVPDSPRIRALEEELIRVFHSRVFNPKWIEAMQRHGYKGAFELAATIDYAFGYGATTGLVRDHHYEALAQKLAIEPELFFLEHNPDALREATGRLLEAVNRGLWQAPAPATLASLENIHFSLEADRE